MVVGVGFVTPKQRRKAVLEKALAMMDAGKTISEAAEASFEDWTGIPINRYNDGDRFLTLCETIKRNIRRQRAK